jgi:hypothetical protein
LWEIFLEFLKAIAEEFAVHIPASEDLSDVQMKHLLETLQGNVNNPELLDFLIYSLHNSESNEEAWIRAILSKNFKIAPGNNQKINEVINKLGELDEKMQNVEKLISMVNGLLLLNGNFKQVMDHFSKNSHYPLYGEAKSMIRCI